MNVNNVLNFNLSKIFLIFFLLFSSAVFTQICDKITNICTNQPGVQSVPNFDNPFDILTSCANLQSRNNKWFRVRIETGNELIFTIEANNNDDYDFAVFGPNPDCNTLDSQTAIRSNFSGTLGNTGLSNAGSNPCESASGNPFSSTINVSIGEEYLIVIDSFVPDGGVDNNSPYTLTFGSNASNLNLDCSIVVGNLGENQEVCAGTTVSLDGTPATGTIDSFQWQLDTGSGFNDLVGETNAILDITTNVSGDYKVIITDTDGNTGEDDVNITFFDVPTATTPTNLIDICDTDRDGFNDFNFDVAITPQILNGQSTTDFEVFYFTTMAAATANVAGTNITSPYRNTTAFTQETIYARVHNVNNNDCSAITSFPINVRDVAAPNEPTDYRLCDDTASGLDTDGITNSFLLNTKDSEILGLSNSALQFNISYHTSLIGAQTDNTTDVIDKNSNYAVTNSETIFVRIENVDNTTCAVTSDDSAASTFTSFELIVDPLPVINNPAELIQCHNNPDLNTTVNLRLARINISSNFVNETFEYYATEADAIAGTPQITGSDIETYPVTGTGQAWVRVISDQDCFRISRIDITVNFSADLAYNRTFIACDDLLDIDGNDTATNSDTDGITSFDFSEATDEIKAFFPLLSRPDLDVFFYESESDRAASINDINSEIANHRNNNDPAFANAQTIYAKIVNNTNNGCSGTANLFLQVNAVPLANNLAQPLILCDDFTSGSSDDGENIGINLRDTVDEILGNTQTEADYIVTYHTSQADATSGADPITNDTDFRNTAPVGFVPGTVSSQTIFVRVTTRNTPPATTCFNAAVSFNIEINPLPELTNTIAPIDVCDVPNATDSDPRNRIAQNIDVTQRNTDILNGRDGTIFSVWFYKSQSDALTDTGRISNATLANYENDPANTTIPTNINSDEPGIETLFFVINNSDTGCSSEPFTLDINIFPEPNIPLNINNYVDCDTDNNGLGNDTDGILENIAFATKIPEILANYTTAEQSNFTISFHRELADAQTGNNPLDTNAYENEVNNQTIFVRVVNNQTMCVYDDLSFQIIINPLPSYDPLDLSQVACLNNLPLTLQVENPLTAYDYSWVENQSGTVISTAQSVDVRAGGTYTLTVIDRVTLCERIEQFDVIESEAATITEDNFAVIDDTSDISGNSFSITINPVGLGVGDYQYALLNEDGDIERDYQDDLIFDRLTGGFYRLLVRDKNGCDINDIPASIEVPVVEFPKFFTPNGDGINDTWTIKGANINYYPSSEIFVYNRFGKIVAKVDLANQGWNGTYGGKRLPSDDYWFSIKLVPFDTSKKTIIKTGNFSLLRK